MTDHPIERGHVPAREQNEASNLGLHIGPVRSVVVPELLVNSLGDARITKLGTLRFDEISDVQSGSLIEGSRLKQNVMPKFAEWTNPVRRVQISANVFLETRYFTVAGNCAELCQPVEGWVVYSADSSCLQFTAKGYFQSTRPAHRIDCPSRCALRNSTHDVEHVRDTEPKTNCLLLEKPF